MKRSGVLALALVVAAAAGLAWMGSAALTAERLRLAEVLRAAHTEALRPLLNGTGALFAEVQAGFLAEAGDARGIPSPETLARAARYPYVRCAYAMEGGRLDTYAARGTLSPHAQQFLSGQQLGQVGKQVQQELTQFAQSRERQTAQQRHPFQGPQQMAAAQSDEPVPMAPVQPALAHNWVLEPASFAELVSTTEAQYLPLLLGNRLEILYWQRSPIESKRGPSGFGFALDAEALRAELARRVGRHPRSTAVVTAIVDDQGQLVGSNAPGWRPSGEPALVALELHARLPHWKLAVHWARPGELDRLVGARTWALGLMLGACGLALAFGLGLLALDLRRESALAAKQADFVSNVSHELRTPLTSIRMYAELVERRFPELPRAVEYARVIQAESDRLAGLVGQILDFSRTRRGLRAYRFQPLDLGSLVAERVAEFLPRCAPAGVALAYEPPPAPLVARGDAEALAQAFDNLLSNALKYGGNGARIDVSLRRDGGAIWLGVRDHGPGVPRRWRRRIFEEFVRMDNALTASTQGSGLGLSLARRIARDHGGELVAAEPPEGAGALFVFTLPESTP